MYFLPLMFFRVLLDVTPNQGPYGNFGKVEDFKVIESKTTIKGKRAYRRVE